MSRAPRIPPTLAPPEALLQALPLPVLALPSRPLRAGGGLLGPLGAAKYGSRYWKLVLVLVLYAGVGVVCWCWCCVSQCCLCLCLFLFCGLARLTEAPHRLSQPWPLLKALMGSTARGVCSAYPGSTSNARRVMSPYGATNGRTRKRPA